jgi:tRNA A37 threonylcarbamoyltransferase TsaD
LSAPFQLSAFSQVFTTQFTCFSSTKVQILASCRFSTFQQSAFLADAGPVAADSALRKKLTKLLSAFTTQFTCFTSTSAFQQSAFLADAGPVAADSALRQKLTKLLSLAQTLRTIEDADRFLLLSLLELLVQKYKY